MFDVNEKGIIMVDAEDWRDDFLSDVYQPAFGENVDVDASTPVGALLSSDVALGMKVQASLAEVANCYNPFSATGANLTKIGNSYGYIRRQATPARATVIFTGQSGLTVPAGFEVADESGNIFTTDNDCKIGEYVGVTCQVTGTVVNANSITKLVSTTPAGVDSVSQPTAGINGYTQESDDEMSARMVKTGYAGRGRGTLGAIAAAISNVTGVYGLSFQENMGDQPIVWRGKTLVAHSIYFCVAGGDDTEIAKAIALTKTNGCSTNGEVTVTFNDPTNSSYTYNYLIDRPVFQPIFVQLISNNGVDLTSSLELFKNALSVSQQYNAFALGATVSSVDVITRIPQSLLDLGIVACNISTDGVNWVKSIDVNADVLIQIPEANVSIIEEEE